MDATKTKLYIREDDERWERLVFAEVLVPESPNTYSDFWTRDAIKEAAYGFMKHGFGIDVDHDNVDRTGGIYIVETFIARDGDPDFIPGSWVVGMRVEDDEVWGRILSGDINGYSYEAVLSTIEALFEGDKSGLVAGITEPDPNDGHVHEYLVRVNGIAEIVGGGTSFVNDHWHSITTHTYTDEEQQHKHRYNILSGEYTDE